MPRQRCERPGAEHEGESPCQAAEYRWTKARMGIRNMRAICPNCGGKIHTQPKGLGNFTWANSWMLVQTGSECQHCGVALSGKVGPGNKAIAAADADKSWWQRTKEEAGLTSPEPRASFEIDPGSIANDPLAAQRATEWEQARKKRGRTTRR